MSKALDEKAREVLADLGHTQEEIEELAQKAKATPEEENVVEKEDNDTPGLGQRIRQELSKMFAPKEPVPVASEPVEARKADEVEEPEQPEEAKAAEEDGAPTGTDMAEMAKTLGPILAKAIGEMVRDQLDRQHEEIVALQEQVKIISASVEEKVEARLSDVPPVVKVAASQTNATAVQDAPRGFRFGNAPQQGTLDMGELVKSITQATKDTYEGAKFQT